MIREVGNTVDANECTVEIGLLLVIWSSLLFSRVSSTYLVPHFILVFVFVSNDSFAAGGPPSSPPTLLLLFLLHLLFSFQFHSLLLVPSPWSITFTPTASSSYYSNLINLILSLFIL